MKVDVLCTPRTPWKGQLLLRCVHEGAARHGLDVRLVGDDSQIRVGAWIVLYGLGAPERIGYADCGRLIAFDAGYWNRKLSPERRSYRVSVNGFHSPAAVSAVPCAGAERLAQSAIGCGPDQPDAGDPILLVGNGPKSVATFAGGWTAAKSRELRQTFPARKILYRPKPKRPIEPGIDHDGIANGAIEDVLKRVSLVVCRHSNVAVDACRAGVPVVCDDGAAAAIYPNSLRNWEQQPSHAVRIDFLQRLAWWQWSPIECRDGGFWPWMLGALAAVR